MGTDELLRRIGGKRLTYRRAGAEAPVQATSEKIFALRRSPKS
jgi:hypothetical protein